MGRPAESPPGEQEGGEALEFLQRATAVLGCELTEQMRQDPQSAAFAESARLLLAVLGFMCEGQIPPMLRGTVVTRAPYLPAWQGLVPHMILREWFDGNDSRSLLNFYGSEALREGFEAASRPQQGHFVTLLSRVAQLEMSRPGAKALRSPWQPVFEQFPELRRYRQLLAQVKRRCWEDARDRSRSRSPKRKVEPKQSKQQEEGTRFILRNAGQVSEEELLEYFQNFGTVVSCNVLRDKRTKKSRGVAFISMRPGVYEGKPITEWMLQETHIVGHMKLEITEAEEKQEKEDDEDRKREERVEERRRARVEKEQRMLRTPGGAASLQEKGEERLVSSHWLRRWRRQLFEWLPKGTLGPSVWAEPCVGELCIAIWAEVAEHCLRCERAVQEAVGMFQDPSQEGRWSFVPAADLLLVLGEGLVGLTALGVFVWPSWQDPVPPRSAAELAVLTKPCFAAPVVGPSLPMMAPPAMAPMMAMPAMPQTAPMAMNPSGPSIAGLKGASDREKIFVGGLPHHCTLEMLTSYFSQYGPITDAVVMMDKNTGKPRGFGFVVFEHVSCAEAAIRDYGTHALDGKWVDVKRATPQDGGFGVPSVFAPAAREGSFPSPEKPRSPERFTEVPPPSESGERSFTSVPPPQL
ncbi:unnamed protein product [Effrenium voratum]|nr:unnamed protein product [Effrenium voratum]